MSDLLNRNRRRSALLADQGVSSMHFWGICCESGKRYAQVVGQRFRITMAVLDPKSFCREDKIVSLVVIRDDIEYLLCVLKHGELHQVNLNLIFDRGENVIFYINGLGRVYLSGYQLTESGDDALTDENGYLCPLVELKSKSKSKKEKSIVNVEPEASTSKKKKKLKGAFEDGDPTLWRKEIVSQAENGETDEDEADSDFSASDAQESESSEESESEEAEEESDDDLEDEIDEDDLEEDEKELVYGSQKRKRRAALQALKRAKTESTSSAGSEENDVIFIADKESDASSNSLDVKANSEAPSSEKKKKKKKKKKLNDISHVSESSEGKNPIQKLEGGVEIQDVVVGRGPVATKGKLVHVFYVGRFEDKTIFDSRTHGKKPFSFKLGVGQVIKGWDVGLQGMRVGGRRKLRVPPNMGYGSSQNYGIPPNSTLFFTIELQNVS